MMSTLTYEIRPDGLYIRERGGMAGAHALHPARSASATP